MTKVMPAKLKKNVLSKIYHNENSKTRGGGRGANLTTCSFNFGSSRVKLENTSKCKNSVRTYPNVLKYWDT